MHVCVHECMCVHVSVHACIGTMSLGQFVCVCARMSMCVFAGCGVGVECQELGQKIDPGILGASFMNTHCSTHLQYTYTCLSIELSAVEQGK